MVIFHGVMFCLFCSTAPINGTYPPLAHLSHLVFDDVLHNLHHGPNFALKPVQLYLAMATRPPGHPPQSCHPQCHVVRKFTAAPCCAVGVSLHLWTLALLLEWSDLKNLAFRHARPEKVCVCVFLRTLASNEYVLSKMVWNLRQYRRYQNSKCIESIWKSWDWLQWRTWHRFKTIFAEWLENHRSWARYLQQQVDFFHLQRFLGAQILLWKLHLKFHLDQNSSQPGATNVVFYQSLVGQNPWSLRIGCLMLVWGENKCVQNSTNIICVYMCLPFCWYTWQAKLVLWNFLQVALTESERVRPPSHPTDALVAKRLHRCINFQQLMSHQKWMVWMSSPDQNMSKVRSRQKWMVWSPRDEQNL